MSAANVITSITRTGLLLSLLAACIMLLPGDCVSAVPQGNGKKPSRSALVNKITQKGPPGAGSENGVIENYGDVNIDVVAMITRDEEGREIGRPGALFYDRQANELYVNTTLDGSRVVLYGPDLFPTVSLGAGRGADAPVSTYVDREGYIYVCQAETQYRSGKIGVFNQAFFHVRDITLEGIPGPAGMLPQKVLVTKDSIYVLTLRNRGVLVLDKEGNFSRWIRPVDVVFNPEGIQELRNATEHEEELVEAEQEARPDVDLSELPPELLPQTSAKSYATTDESAGEGYVSVIDIQVDENGNLYLLSSETGNIYVYNAQEEFLFAFGEKGGSTGKLARPTGLAIDNERRAVFVVDFMRHTILIYDMGGRFMYEFGGRGNGPGWFNFPDHITFNGDNHLLVADRYNSRVQVMDVDFTYKFPLFQVPFVEEDVFEPQPMAQVDNKKYLAPGGFDPGEQASFENKKMELYRVFQNSVM